MSQQRDPRFARGQHAFSVAESTGGGNPVSTDAPSTSSGRAADTFPSEWLPLLAFASAQFGMSLLEEGSTAVLSSGDVDIHVRHIADGEHSWAVLAMPVIHGDEADLPENLHYFAVLNHQMMHVMEVPLVMALNPKSQAIEALLQVDLHDLSEAEFTDLLADFMQSLRVTLQVAA